MGMGVVGVQEEDSSHGSLFPIPILLLFIHEAEGEMGFRQLRVDAQCLERRFLGLAEPDRALVPASADQLRIAKGQAGVRQGIIRIELQGFEVHLDGDALSRS